jgi:hypothetical protein
VSYYLHLYVIPEVAPIPSGLQPEGVPDFVRENASEMGELQFQAGSSLSLLRAAGELACCDLSALQSGVWRGFDGGEGDENFGSMSRDKIQQASREIRALAARPTGLTELAKVAERYRLDPEVLKQFLIRLLRLFDQCAAAGGEVIGIYG